MFYNWNNVLEVSIETENSNIELDLCKEELGHIVRTLMFMADISHEHSSNAEIALELANFGIFVEVCSKNLDEDKNQALLRALRIYLYNRYVF